MQLSPEQQLNLLQLAARLKLTPSAALDFALDLAGRRQRAPRNFTRASYSDSEIPRRSHPPAELTHALRKVWQSGFSAGVLYARHPGRKTMWMQNPYTPRPGEPELSTEYERKLGVWNAGFKAGEKRVEMTAEAKKENIHE